MAAESKEQRLRSFESCYKTLNNNLNTYGKFQPWLTFSMVNTYDDGSELTSLTIDTYTCSATVRLPNESAQTISPIMLTNFEYNKNGSAQANTFSLSFAFNPGNKDQNGGRVVDPMIIDKAITISSFYTVEDGKYKAIDTIAKHKCYLRYGYSFGGEILDSPQYYGQALKASSELRDGMIYYTITGYSSITYISEMSISVKKIENERASVIMANAIKSAFRATSDIVGPLQVENSVTVVTDVEEGQTTDKFDNSAISSALNKLYKGVTVSIKNAVTSDQENQITEAEFTSGSLFSYLDSVSASADLKCNEGRQADKKAKLTYDLEEMDKSLIFNIYIEDPENDENKTDEESQKLKTNIVYQYPNQNNNVVVSFTPDFNFETIWGKDIFVDDDNVNSKNYYIDSDGVIQSYRDPKSTTLLSGANNNELKGLATFSTAIQYSYKAEMTTLGIPSDIPIGTIVTIIPVINGKQYHYAGEYMVLSTTDRIDMNGYTTEYSLFKLVPQSINESEILEDEIDSAKETVKQQEEQKKSTTTSTTSTKLPSVTEILKGATSQNIPLPSATNNSKVTYNRQIISTPSTALTQQNLKIVNSSELSKYVRK